MYCNSFLLILRELLIYEWFDNCHQIVNLSILWVNGVFYLTTSSGLVAINYYEDVGWKKPLSNIKLWDKSNQYWFDV